MRVDETLLDKGWYFAISAAVFGNVINSSTSKCGAQNVIKFKEQLNKTKLLARAFPLLLYAGQVQKREKDLGKRYTNQVKYI